VNLRYSGVCYILDKSPPWSRPLTQNKQLILHLNYSVGLHVEKRLEFQLEYDTPPLPPTLTNDPLQKYLVRTCERRCPSNHQTS